jgi:transcriptional regulator with XRE-family HTH domain
LTQERLGELLEVTYVSIHRWETGKQAIPRLVELALLGLEHVVLAPPEAETAKALSAADELLLALGRERGLDVDSGVSEALRTMRAEVDNAADIEAAASGNRLAMIRLRKAVGLRAFR